MGQGLPFSVLLEGLDGFLCPSHLGMREVCQQAGDAAWPCYLQLLQRREQWQAEERGRGGACGGQQWCQLPSVLPAFPPEAAGAPLWLLCENMQCPWDFLSFPACPRFPALSGKNSSTVFKSPFDDLEWPWASLQSDPGSIAPLEGSDNSLCNLPTDCGFLLCVSQNSYLNPAHGQQYQKVKKI